VRVTVWVARVGGAGGVAGWRGPRVACAAVETIEGDGIRLRTWRAADAEALTPLLDDPIVRRWSSLAWMSPADWIALRGTRPESISFAIVTPDADDEPLGNVGLHHLDLPARRGELSYWLLPCARGRGLATRAARALVRHGFEVMGLESIVLDIEVDNEASQAVARRLGAVPVEAGRAEADGDGVVRRLVLWELVAPPSS
jgi:[ribosomal protein S5]-alanine N-acetyltransferase